MNSKIPFNKPYIANHALEYIQQAQQINGHISGNGPFSKKCGHWLEKKISCQKALLTHSCTAALEMAALLIDLSPGDEVIMPSFTFVSTANAFVLRGAVPVFIDIHPDTLNLDVGKIEQALTPKTKAIVPVHYAGISCEMDTILKIADQHQLFVIEDAAQGILSTYKGRCVGAMGHLAALSFHETKTISSGEGGALLINDKRFIDRAEIIREKGTNRSQFSRGRVDKYTWVDLGSSYLPSDILAAFLWSQLELAEEIIQKRQRLWNGYHEAFADLEQQGRLVRPKVSEHCTHNAHLYYLLLPDKAQRDSLLKKLDEQGIMATFHYVPLHDSPAGKRYGRFSGDLFWTKNISERLIRLPLWMGMDDKLDHIIGVTREMIGRL